MSKDSENVIEEEGTAPAVFSKNNLPKRIRKITPYSRTWPNSIIYQGKFVPYSKEEDMVKYLVKKIADIDFKKQKIDENKVMAIRVPVWLKEHGRLHYRYDDKVNVNVHYTSGLIVPDFDFDEYNMLIPKKDKALFFGDFAEPQYKFLAIKSNIDYIDDGDLFYFRNDITLNRISGMSYFYGGLQLTIISKDSILFAKKL